MRSTRISPGGVTSIAFVSSAVGILWGGGDPASSVLFLVSYVIYHNSAGMTKFLGEGLSRKAYFFILFTHIPLAVTVVPFAIATLTFGLSEKFDKHRRIARWTLPLWLYVSVTGVIVYLMLYQM